MGVALTARIGVAGAGLVGVRHARIVDQEATLAGIADPSPAASGIARSMGVPLYPDVDAMAAAGGLDGVIVATPNQRHAMDARTCINAGLPVLVEKPITSDVQSGEELVAAAADARVPLLVGHHRRHNPLIVTARQAIADGLLGRVVSVHAMCWLFKPDPYFDVSWRREPGAGPILVNLIHDVDLLMYLCGEVSAVQAVERNTARGFAVEDAAAVLLHFQNGAIGTVNVSDTITAPWSWELTAAENPAYPATGRFAYMIGGTDASLSVPDLALWSNPQNKGWHEPIESRTLPSRSADPLVEQVRHFSHVCLKRAKPVVTGVDGLRALRVVSAIKQAASTGGIVDIPG